jgi:hypothetical protein
MASNKKDASFVVGMKSPSLAPGQADKLLKDFLSYDARLSDSVREGIASSEPIALKGPLAEMCLAYGKHQPLEIKDDGRKLLDELRKLLSRLKSQRDGLDEIESLLKVQGGSTKAGSEASKQVSACLTFLSDAQSKLDKTVRQIQIPKAGGKPDVLVKQIYDSTSAVIVAAIMVHAAYKGLKKLTS